jgi:hypothetical protein
VVTFFGDFDVVVIVVDFLFDALEDDDLAETSRVDVVSVASLVANVE